MPAPTPRPFRPVHFAMEAKVHSIIPGVTSEMINTFHFAGTNAFPGNPECADVAAFMEHAVTDYLAPLVNVGVSFTLVEVKSMAEQNGGEAQRVLTQLGLSAGAADRAVIAPLISWRTGEGGRAKHGRLYLPVPSRQDMTDTGPTSGFRILAQTKMNAMIADAAGGTYPLIVASKEYDLHTVILTAVLSNKLTYQKRRDINRGS